MQRLSADLQDFKYQFGYQKFQKRAQLGEYKIGMFNKQVTKDNLSENNKQINNSGEGN